MFTARLATAIVLLAACISALFFLPNAWWTALLLLVVAAGAWEWSALARLRGAARWSYAVFVLASAIAVWGLIDHAPAIRRHLAPEALIYGAASLFWAAVAPLWLARGWRIRSRALLAATGWIVIVPAWLALAQLQAEPRLLLALLGVIWLSDTAAYLVGRTWGRYKLAPTISPGKTWEGLAGAGVAVAVYYVVLLMAAPVWSGWSSTGGAILIGAVALMGVVGDLFESWIKRQAEVKDSGGLLPGHGGVLDRIDSVTAALPVAALLLSFV